LPVLHGVELTRLSAEGPGLPTLVPRNDPNVAPCDPAVFGIRTTSRKSGVSRPLLVFGLRMNPNGESGF
jgi:hypothetical protein